MDLTLTERTTFYRNSIRDLIEDRNSSILVCGGGPIDKAIFEELGFHDVTISNLDSRMDGNAYAPFEWKHANAESLPFHDESFDYAVIHSAAHHASSPHNVLTEMYRVARKGIFGIESRDSITIRFLEWCGITQTYEHAAVYYNDCKFGGINNTEIPNFIYRWTEREIEKTIQSYAPCYKHNFVYKYGSAFPCTPELRKGWELTRILLKFVRPFFYVLAGFFPKQRNLFAFYVEKPTIGNSLYPWLIFDDEEGKITFNKAWGDRTYKKPTER